jgi:hypothetical protein
MALFELREHRKQQGLAGIRHLTAWTASAFYAERGRWFLWAPVIFSLGIAAYFKLPIEPPTIWCIVITAVVLSLHMIARATRSSVSIITVVLLIATLGLTTAKLRTERVAAPVLPVALKRQSFRVASSPWKAGSTEGGGSGLTSDNSKTVPLT